MRLASRATGAAATVALALACDLAIAAPLSPCRLKGVEREVRCGSITMPEDPDAAAARQIRIHFAVVPALAKNRAADPVFVFAGGPGQSAIRSAALVQPLFANLNARRDIVYVDQRGTGRSNALACETPPAAEPLAQQLDIEVARLRLEACLRTLIDEKKNDLRQYATWIAVRDIDAVRAQLGYEQINVWGGSYGTRAALEYLRQFPMHVRTVVLDGVAPADMMLPLSFSFDTEEMLQRLVARCRTDADCNASYPDVDTRLVELLKRAGRAPLRAQVQHPLTGVRETVSIDRTVLASALRAPLYVPQFAAVLPHALLEAARDDFAALIALATALSSNVAESLALGMHYAVICAEDVPRMDAAARQAAARTRFGTAFAELYDATCKQVPTRPVPPAFYSVSQADVPVLILSGGVDPATPTRHGAAVAAKLKRAVHLAAPNLGHGISAHGCAPELINKFVRDATLDAKEGGCLARLPAPTFFHPPRLDSQ